MLATRLERYGTYRHCEEPWVVRYWLDKDPKGIGQGIVAGRLCEPWPGTRGNANLEA